MPGLDPADGGAAAGLPILLEIPGPGLAMDDGAPRIVSCDNRTGTARNLARFLGAAGIARRDTLLWNAVLWIVHAPGARDRALRRDEIVAGRGYYHHSSRCFRGCASSCSPAVLPARRGTWLP